MKLLKHTLLIALLCHFFSNSIFAQTLADTLEQKVLNATAQGHVVDHLSNHFSENPKGEFLLAPQNKNLKYGILIYHVTIFPDRAQFSAAIAFRDPRSNQLIAFKADHVNFSYTNGLSGPVKLYLISDVNFQIGAAADITIEAGEQNTYATFDCSGLQEFGISGQVNFNNQFILPVNEEGKALENKKLNAQFAIKAKFWNDLIIQISLDPFQVKGLNNYVFSIQEATMDLSEAMNANGIVFPETYYSNYKELNLWEGFYLQKGSVKLPEHFNSTDQKRTELGVQNLLIDEFGFSGSIFGTQLLAYEKGRIGGWQFSIDRMEINLLQNEIVKGQFNGALGMPILPDTSKLNYNAYISTNDNYGMMVSIDKKLSIPAFKIGNLVLTKNSYVNMQIIEGDLNLEAQLNGEFSISNKEKIKLQFPAIVFQGLRVSNKEPKIDIDYLGLKNTGDNGNKLSNYPLSIESIGLRKINNEKRIEIKFGLNLMEKISVRSSVSIVAESAENKQANAFQFKRIDLNEIAIKGNISCFTLKGSLIIIKENPIYGNGMNGQIQFTMEQPKIMANANILFGTINNHRYWYFDADAAWQSPGLPFLPGVEINGFVGGAWQGMRISNNKDIIDNDGLGKNALGNYYVPDNQSGLGLRAGLAYQSTGGSASSKPFIAKTVLEIQFNKNSGINSLALFGYADFMTKNKPSNNSEVKQAASQIQTGDRWKSYLNNYQPTGAIGGPIMLQFNFAQKIYQANFAIFIQGIANDKIKGRGINGLAGEASVYFGNNKWYVWLGTPQNPIGVKMNFGNSGNAMIDAYFMAGNEVKPSGPLPKEITNLIGNQNADAMRQLNELATGNAFAFGARLDLEIGSEGGEKNISIYASLKLIAGFDINLANYGKNTYCEGRSEAVGINGWMANGQLYAYLQGKVGASVHTKTIKTQFDLLTLTAAAQLYCQGPNPFYSNGTAYVQVNIAGVINSKLRLNFEIGEPCQLQKRNFSDTTFILTTNPENNSNSISVLQNLETRFSIPINKPLKDANGEVKIFRLKQYELSENGKQIKGNFNWNNEQNTLLYEPNEMLPGKKQIKLKILVEACLLNSTYELRNGNTKISPSANELLDFQNIVALMESQNILEKAFGKNKSIHRVDTYKPIQWHGENVSEFREITFTTKQSANNIDPQNIAFAYPLINQMNYYPEISQQGYIQLTKEQPNVTQQANTKIEIIFADQSGQIVASSNAIIAGKRINYQIPNTNFKPNQIYSLYLIRRSLNAPTLKGQTVQNTILKSNTSSANLNVTGNTVSISAAQSQTTDVILLNYYFSTSHYPSFKNKIEQFKIPAKAVLKNNEQGDVLLLKLQNDKQEYFENTELNVPNLMRPQWYLEAIPWFTQEGKKVFGIYNCGDPSILKYIHLSRDTIEYGMPPRKALAINETKTNEMLLYNQKKNGPICKPNYSDESIEIENKLQIIIGKDLEDIKISLINYVCENKTMNEKALAKYLNSLNASANNWNKNQANTTPMQNNLSISSLSKAIITPSEKINSTPYTSSQNHWLAAISQLKLNSLPANSGYPIIFYYYLPGEISPIQSAVLTTKNP